MTLVPPFIYSSISIIKSLQHNFPKIGGRGGESHLEFFRKFIRFGSLTLPLVEEEFQSKEEFALFLSFGDWSGLGAGAGRGVRKLES